MKKIAFAGALLVSLLLTGCGASMDELIEARGKCEVAGGTFQQWRTDLGEFWRCDFEREGATQ